MTEIAATRLWPFLTGRARETGHLVVVVPRFLADTSLGGDLTARIGPGVPAADEAPDWAFTQSLARPPANGAAGSLHAVFRRYKARAADFALGDGPLLDSGLRAIIITEGVVVESPDGDLPALTDADMRAAHAAVVPAYQEFWEEDRKYQATFSTSAGPAGQGTPLQVRVLPPDGTAAEPIRSPGPELGAAPVPPSWLAPSPPGGGPRRPQLPPARRRLVTAAVVGALAAGAIGYAIGRGASGSLATPSPGKPVPSTSPATSARPGTSMPGSGSLGTLTAIGVLQPDDIWVGGTSFYQWTGTGSWKKYPFPSGVTGTVTRLWVVSQTSAWALISARDGSTVVVQWAGKSWTSKPKLPGGSSGVGRVRAGTVVWVFSSRGQVALSTTAAGAGSGRLPVPGERGAPAAGWYRSR